ncbi:MAG TPA: phospholipase D-like domain-containing protein [Thermoanaerobaculia bacterium]
MSLPLRKPEKDKEKKPTKEPKSAPARWLARTVEVSHLALILYAFIVVFLFVMIWSVLHERQSHVTVPRIASFEQALPAIANLGGSAVLPGNSVQILENGDGFFPPFLADIAQARASIHLETYVWWKGEICDRIARALADKARQGVEVRITLDATGSHRGDDKLYDMMKKAGVKIALYHPFRLGDLGLLNNRTHRKLAVFDGRIAYVFGHGIAEEWTGNAQDKDHWRDTGVRLQGPIVNSVQAVFAQNWVDETAEVLVGEKYFPHLAAAGPVRAHMTASAPRGGVSEMELIDKLAIASAQKELIIQNPYFIPDKELVDLIGNAVQRGVRVRLMIPGQITDSSVVRHAGHKQFQALLDKGVEIDEFEPTLSHQKIMIIDGVWSFVGSTNFDDRSLDINDEASVGLIDPGIAGQLKAAFEADLKRCKHLDARTWSHRSLWHKLEDQLSYAINEQL